MICDNSKHADLFELIQKAIDLKSDNFVLGKAVREYYLENKESILYQTPKNFREDNEQSKHGTHFGMK